MVSWEQGRIPPDFSDAVFITLYKNKEKLSDRGITPPFAGKILAGGLLTMLVPTIVEENLSESQCGFRVGRGTTDIGMSGLESELMEIGGKVGGMLGQEEEGDVRRDVRFLFILLGPKTKAMAYHQIGRAVATLLTDEVFEIRGLNVDFTITGMSKRHPHPIPADEPKQAQKLLRCWKRIREEEGVLYRLVHDKKREL
eukprot:g46224.t1